VLDLSAQEAPKRDLRLRPEFTSSPRVMPQYRKMSGNFALRARTFTVAMSLALGLWHLML